MRWIAVVVSFVSACVQSNAVSCPDGLVCPNGSSCAVVTGVPTCATPEQLDACADKGPLEGCDAADDRKRCYDGVCLDVCGNGRMDPGEVCDDANTIVGDGCSDRCQDETCGNSIADTFHGEECDEGPGVSGDGCSSTCKIERPEWQDITPRTISARSGHAMASDNNSVLTFGGRSDSDLLSDTWLRTVDGTWIQLRPPRSPPARTHHSIAYDSLRNRYVLFGGFGIAGVLGDTWEWDGVTWTERTPPTSPPPRYGTKMAYAPTMQRTVLVGGRTLQDGLDDMWTWDGTTWQEIAAGTGLSETHAHVELAYHVDRGELIYCGSGASGSMGNLTMRWSGSAWIDTGVPCPTSATSTNSHRLAYSRLAAALVVFVDQDSSVREWTGSAWAPLTFSGGNGPPSLRSFAGFAPTDDRIVLFGGASSGGVPVAGTPDALYFDLGSSTWMWITENILPPSPDERAFMASTYDPYNGVAINFGTSPGSLGTWMFGARGWEDLFTNGVGSEPADRAGAAMAFDLVRREAVMHGGIGGGELDETWVLSRDTSWQWTQRTPATSPGARRGAQLAFDAARGRAILFGGNTGMTLRRDTWSWDGTTWMQVATTGPTPRTRHAMAYDAARERIVLFGGYDSLTGGGTLSDETWEWDGATWTQFTPATKPAARAGATLTYDPLRRRVVLVGGTDYPQASGTFDDWWEWDGSTWQRIGNDSKVARSGHMAFYDPFRRGLVVFGGNKTAIDYDVANSETLILRYVSNESIESCELPEDGDGDGMSACADPDCWGRCAPLCPPQATCAADAPRCGDGVCSPLEDYLICPGPTVVPPTCEG